MFNLKPIGFIQSCYPDKFGTPRQAGLIREAQGQICLEPWVQAEEALKGLEGFSHIWVLFWFHQNNMNRYHAKIHPPRLGGESIGVFATRSPHRPNPIGLSLYELDRIENGRVFIRGCDVINGTPVFDLKPYLPEVEAPAAARAGWTTSVDRQNVSVEWPLEQLEHLAFWSQKLGQPNLKKLIEKTLQLDPRPLVYRGYEGEETPYRSEHAVRLFDGDVHFKFLSSNQVQVTKILYPGNGL